MLIQIQTSEAFQKAVTDHRDMSEFTENLNHVAEILNESETLRKIEKMRQFLQRHIAEHYTLEESVVFPELLRQRPDAQTHHLIQELELDHEVVRREVEKMTALLTQAGVTPEPQVLEQIERTFREVIGGLQRHAAKEDELLVPLLKALSSASQQS